MRYIAIATLLAHWPLLTGDVVMWDDWRHLIGNRPSDWDFIRTVHEQHNMAPAALWSWVFFQAGEHAHLLARAASLALTCGTGSLVYAVARRFIDQKAALWSALFAVAFPGFLAHGSISLNFFSLCLFLFMVSLWLALKSEEAVGWRHVGLRVAALALAFYSFTTGSLLVFYAGYVILHASVVGWRSYHRRSDFILLPFIFWAARYGYAQTHFVYSNYNELRLDALSIVLFVIAAGAMAALCRRPTAVSFAVLLLAAGTIPYAMVGKLAIAHHPFDTRHFLLVGIGTGLLIASLLRSTVARAAVLLVFASITAGSEVRTIERSAFDRAVLRQLALAPEAKSVDVFLVDDRAGMLTNIWVTWPYMLRTAFGGDTWKLGMPIGTTHTFDHLAGHAGMKYPDGRITAILIVRGGGEKPQLELRPLQ